MIKVIAKVILKAATLLISIAISIAVTVVFISWWLPDVRATSAKYLAFYVMASFLVIFVWIVYQIEKIRQSLDVKIEEVENHFTDLSNMILSKKLRSAGVPDKSPPGMRKGPF